jgi:ATP-dependent DNA helicase HFM1/MER3
LEFIQVHLLNEDTRGPTLEAVVSRMKTIELSLQLNSTASVGPKGIRFLAVSATIPNIVDIAKWIGYGSVEPFKFFW